MLRVLGVKKIQKVHFIIKDPLEDVLLIVDLPGVEHVENLDNDEDVENVCVVSACTHFVSVLAVQWGSIPVSQPARKEVRVLFIV